MTITNVTVLGTGVLGSQIAFQTAYRGFTVLAYDLDDAAIAKARKTIDVLATRYARDLPDALQGQGNACADAATPQVIEDAGFDEFDHHEVLARHVPRSEEHTSELQSH